jgi:uncharacterized protein (UPF0332 family)
MDFRDYLRLAAVLANGPGEAEWRSAVSRAYYAAFHVARRLLTSMGFRVPQADRAHAHLWLRLANSGHSDVQIAATRLNDLRRERNRADYDEGRPMRQATAAKHVQTAEEVVRVLDAASVAPTRSRVAGAMIVYERDVLRDVTWHP